jgi:hypothetical protein
MNEAPVGQVVVLLAIVVFGAMVLVRVIGDFLLMFRDVVERYRRYRWEANLWRSIAKSLNADRRAIRQRRLRKV